MRIGFLGNHTVGVRTLTALMESADVVHVVAHPPDPEDGVVYESVHDFARRRGLDTSRLTGHDAALIPLIERIKPDLLWIADYRYLLPGEVLALSRLGAINLHPSLLPKYRGRASLNWAIIHGERTLGLTAHFVDEGPDSGDVIEQMSFELAEHEDVSDALRYLYPMYGQVTTSVLSALHRGSVSRKPQDHALASVFPRRRPQDGLIDFRAPARRVRDLIRAVAKPYPGAFGYLGGARVMFWKSVLDLRGCAGRPGEEGRPGEIVKVDGAGSFSVMCGDAVLRIVEHSMDSADGQEPAVCVGQCFDSCDTTGS